MIAGELALTPISADAPEFRSSGTNCILDGSY